MAVVMDTDYYTQINEMVAQIKLQGKKPDQIQMNGEVHEALKRAASPTLVDFREYKGTKIAALHTCAGPVPVVITKNDPFGLAFGVTWKDR